MRVPGEYVSMNDLNGCHTHLISEKTFVLFVEKLNLLFSEIYNKFNFNSLFTNT